jgi:hypothetical protein
MSEEEKKAVEYLTKYIHWETYGERSLETDIKIVLKLVEKQQKEVEEYRKFKKDIVSKIMFWDKKELPNNEVIIEMINTLISEVSRLEDIEDKKVKVAVDFIEAKRDKFWKDKIREKIKELKEIADEDNLDVYTKIDVLEELLEEK